MIFILSLLNNNHIQTLAILADNVISYIELINTALAIILWSYAQIVN